MIREPGSFGISLGTGLRRYDTIKKDLAKPNPFLFTASPYTGQMMVVVF